MMQHLNSLYITKRELPSARWYRRTTPLLQVLASRRQARAGWEWPHRRMRPVRVVGSIRTDTCYQPHRFLLSFSRLMHLAVWMHAIYLPAPSTYSGTGGGCCTSGVSTLRRVTTSQLTAMPSCDSIIRRDVHPFEVICQPSGPTRCAPESRRCCWWC